MLAPIIAGFLFRDGYSVQFVAIAMSAGSLVAAAALWLLPFKAHRFDSIDAAGEAYVSFAGPNARVSGEDSR